MSEELYFVISNSDGDTTVYPYTKEALESQLNDPDGSGLEGDLSLEDLRKEIDTNYWGDKVLIIKGKVVQQKSVETVTRTELSE
jgi:hypothetical protein